MATFQLLKHKNTNNFAHHCKICDKGYRIRGHKRKYLDICGSCAISFSVTNCNRIRRGQKPLSYSDYRCKRYAEKIYAFLASKRIKE